MIRNILPMATLLTLLAIPAKSWSAPPNQSQDQIQLQSPSEAPAAFKSAEGELSRVDNTQQLLWIKGQDGKEMEFEYTSETEVTGGDNTVEGLAKMCGTHLKIQYEIVGGVNIAVKIDVAPAQG